MKKPTFFDLFVEDFTEVLRSDHYFDDFKYRKRDASFILKFKGGWKKLELERWHHILGTMSVRPYYMARFDIIEKWFEQFDYRSLTDMRNSSTLYYSGRELGVQEIFEFERDEEQFVQEYQKFVNTVIPSAKWVFENAGTIEGYYEYFVVPVLKKEQEVIGDSVMFKNLAACKIVSPKDYPELKSVILETVRHWKETGNYGAVNFYDKMDDIIAYLDKADFKS